MRALGRVILSLGQVATAALAIWAIGWLALGDEIGAVRAGLYLAPFLLAASVMLALAALILGQRMAALAAGLVAVLLAASAPASLTRISTIPLGPGLTLTTLSNRTQNTDMAATARALKARVADIFVLQEIADPAALIDALTGLYRPGRRPHHCAMGSYVIVSRFRIGPARRLAGNVAIRCPVDLPGGPAIVYAVHLPRALTDGGRQMQAVSVLLADAARQAGPVIIAGDFNATPLTGTMQRAAGALVNAFDQAGRGPGFTFPTPARRLGAVGPFLRIDHVLLGPAFRPVWARAARWHPPGADHFPVETGFADLRGARP